MNKILEEFKKNQAFGNVQTGKKVGIFGGEKLKTMKSMMTRRKDNSTTRTPRNLDAVKRSGGALTLVEDNDTPDDQENQVPNNETLLASAILFKASEKHRSKTAFIQPKKIEEPQQELRRSQFFRPSTIIEELPEKVGIDH